MALEAWRKQDTPNRSASKCEVSELSVAELLTPSQNIFKSRMLMAFPPMNLSHLWSLTVARVVFSGCPSWLPFCLLSQLPAAKHIARLSIEQAGCPIFATNQDPLTASRYISTWGGQDFMPQIADECYKHGVKQKMKTNIFLWSCEAKLKKMSMLPCSCFFPAKQWDKMSKSWRRRTQCRQAAKDRRIKWPQLLVTISRHLPHYCLTVFSGCEDPWFIWKYLPRSARPWSRGFAILATCVTSPLLIVTKTRERFTFFLWYRSGLADLKRRFADFEGS